jgi:hypothetical protein
MALDSALKKQIMTDYATVENDTGSPEVQVAMLTRRISDLTEDRYHPVPLAHRAARPAPLARRGGRSRTTGTVPSLVRHPPHGPTGQPPNVSRKGRSSVVAPGRSPAGGVASPLRGRTPPEGFDRAPVAPDAGRRSSP